MAYIPFVPSVQEGEQGYLTILIFTEGTIIGPTKLVDWFNFRAYTPIGNCVAKIRTWANQGASIYYLTSRKSRKQVCQIMEILTNHGFPGEGLFYRAEKEKYRDLAEILKPKILIEDDCRSIGG